MLKGANGIQTVSAGLLQAKVHDFFRTSQMDVPLLIDYEIENFPIGPLPKDLDVVLMGNFFSELLNIDFWPERNYRIWVLSSRLRNLLIEVLGIPENSMNLIPRTQLFPPAKTKDFPVLSAGLRLIYSGRFMRSKNIILLVLLVWELQQLIKAPIELICCGEFDDREPFEFGSSVIERQPLQSELRQIIESFSWLAKPRFVHQLAATEWLKYANENSVGISLSMHPKEDFGVSLAQLQMARVPIIASDWGGHADTVGSVLLPCSLLAHPTSDLNEQRRSAKKLASFLAQNWGLPNSKFSLESKRLNVLNSSYVSKAFLKSFLNKALEAYDMKVAPLTTEELRSKFSTEKGRALAQRMEGFWNGTNSSE